jgi:hypothetical protein
MEHTPAGAETRSVGVLDREPTASVEPPSDDLRPRAVADGETVFARQVRFVTAICSFGAALLHVLAMIDHRSEPTLARSFLAIAAIQVVWGVLLIVDPRKLFVLAGTLVTAGAITVWVFSRTKGISWFPGLDHVEPLGWRDVVTQFYQLLAVAGGAILLLPASVYRAAGKKVDVVPAAVFAVFAMAVMIVLYAATHATGHH